MPKIHIIIDGIRHEVKQDAQLIFEDVAPEGGPEQTDVRIWAFQDKISPTGEQVPAHVLLDWSEDDKISLHYSCCVGEFVNSLF